MAQIHGLEDHVFFCVVTHWANGEVHAGRTYETAEKAIQSAKMYSCDGYYTVERVTVVQTTETFYVQGSMSDGNQFHVPRPPTCGICGMPALEETLLLCQDHFDQSYPPGCPSSTSGRHSPSVFDGMCSYCNARL